MGAGEMNAQIVYVLRDLGIPANLLGYEYLKSAIRLCLEDRTYINFITKRLYPEVAKQYDTTPNRAERAIRHAIEAAWNRGDPDRLEHYFGWTVSSKRSKPTNGEFIATVVEQLRMEQEAAG